MIPSKNNKNKKSLQAYFNILRRETINRKNKEFCDFTYFYYAT